MMITIHGFPAKTKYQDVKLLIKQECSINDFILDNLINDSDGTKKVRIGLADNTEGYKVMKCLDGYRMPGNFVLKAIPIGKTASNLPQPSAFDSGPSYQPRNDYSNAPRNDYMSQPNDYNNQGSHGTGPPLSHGGIHGPMGAHVGPHSGPHVSGGPQGPIDSMSRPSPWVAGGGNSQWNTPMATQVPQNTFGYTSPQANVNPPYGQQQSHPRTGFNQGRPADQGYGYTPKNVPEVIPANSRYRWVRKAVQEPDVPKSTGNDEGSTEGPSFADDIFNENSQDVPNDSEKQPSKQLTTSDNKLSTKYIQLKKSEQREISRFKTTKRKRFFFWMKQGKTFAEAKELCEIGLKKVPEYAVVKADMKKRARENEIRCMSPERQARAIKLERLKGRGTPGTPAQPRPKCNAMWVRLFDKLGCMPVEKIEMLEDKVLELMDAEADGNVPSFIGYRRSNFTGSLVLSCENAQTLEWLENHLPDFQLWEGAQVKIRNVADEPERVVAIACIPLDPRVDEKEIIVWLSLQNAGIDFSDWWITHMKPEHKGAQTVVFSIDNLSVNKLAERNNYLYFGHKKIKIRFNKKLREKQQAKGKMDMPPEGPNDIASIDQTGLPPERPSGTASIDQAGMQPPKGRSVVASIDQKNLPSKSQTGMKSKVRRGMPHKGHRGMALQGQRGITHAGQRGMAPQGQSGMPHVGQRGMAPQGQSGMPHVGQRGMAPQGQSGMPHVGQRGMAPQGQSGMPHVGQRGMAPQGQHGMPHEGQRGMAPQGQSGMRHKGQRGMAPQEQLGMPHKEQRGMAPQGQHGMPHKGQRGMAPKGQRGMPSRGHRGMRPMNMGHMGPIDMGYMEPIDMDYIPTGFSNPPGFSQCRNLGGGNQQKYFGGGKNHKKKPEQDGWLNYGGGYPRPGKNNKN